MVCPLRFVLVGLSATVAVAVALHTSWYPSEDEVEVEGPTKGSGRTQGGGDTDERSVRPGRSLLQTVLDMFTGRYLYQLYQEKYSSPKMVKGLDNGDIIRDLEALLSHKSDAFLQQRRFDHLRSAHKANYHCSLRTSWYPSEDEVEVEGPASGRTQGGGDTDERSVRPGRSLLQTVLDMFTGRYLYQLYQEKYSSPKMVKVA